MRSTALHNTLTIDGRSQSIPNGPFHWSHVANGRVHRWRTSRGFDYFDGSQDGYRPIEHRRRVLVMHGDLVVVADFIAGPGAHAAAVHWHLDPKWSWRHGPAVHLHARRRRRCRVGLTVPRGWSKPSVATNAQAGVVLARVRPGRAHDDGAHRHQAPTPFWMVSVFDLDRRNPVADVAWTPVWAEGGVVAHAAAIRITRAASVDHVLFAEPRTETVVPSWRVGDVETDARMLVYRSTIDEPLACLGFVDGSLARAAGRRGFTRTLPAIVPVFFFRTRPTDGAERGNDDEPRRRRTTNQNERTTNDEDQADVRLAGCRRVLQAHRAARGSAPARSYTDVRVIAQRGSDDEGIWIDQASPWHARLSIIDLSTGHQPIHKGIGPSDCLQRRDLQLPELRRELESAGPSSTPRATRKSSFTLRAWGKAGHRPSARDVRSGDLGRRRRGFARRARRIGSSRCTTGTIAGSVLVKPRRPAARASDPSTKPRHASGSSIVER